MYSAARPTVCCFFPLKKKHPALCREYRIVVVYLGAVEYIVAAWCRCWWKLNCEYNRIRCYEYIGECALIGRDAPQCVITEALAYIMWRKSTHARRKQYWCHSAHMQMPSLVAHIGADSMHHTCRHIQMKQPRMDKAPLNSCPLATCKAFKFIQFDCLFGPFECSTFDVLSESHALCILTSTND